MNYADLFRVTLPETALEVAALLVLVVDLAFANKAALKVRVAVAALLGVLGCCAALALLPCAGSGGFRFGDEILLASGGIAMAALPVPLVAGVLGAAAAFAFVLDMVKLSAFARLGIG